MFEDGSPLFVQLATEISQQILTGEYTEGAQVPSINELAAFYRINPATANRAVADLVARGLLVKRRGIGMFVAPGARAAITNERRAALAEAHIRPLIAEARALGLDLPTLIELIKKESPS